MSPTAAPEREADRLVSRPGVQTIYLARRSSLRLVKTPRYDLHGAGGRKVGEQPGEVVMFVDGRFDCPPEGTVVLEDGRTADAAEITAWLEGHRLNGSIEEGFWKVDATAPAPSAAEMKTLMRLSQLGDVDGLELFIAQEREGWNRADLLETAEESLAASRKMLAVLAEEKKKAEK